MKFEVFFGQPKHYEIAWFLSQWKDCNSYYKCNAVFYNYAAKKALKKPPQPLYPINPPAHLPCFATAQGWFCQLSGPAHGSSRPTNITPSLPTLPATPPSPWSATTTTVWSSTVAQTAHALFQCCCATGCFSTTLSTTGGHPLQPRTLVTYSYLRLPPSSVMQPQLSPIAIQRGRKNPFMILQFVAFLG